ncbi:MAG: inositol monophosphatase [Candidatus Marinimicrobia bacterium]|nr:inositol monophosphatase [Candidatus Neomarinimicrobiota bacterium]
MNLDLSFKLNFTMSLAKEAGEILMYHYGNLKNIRQKSRVDLVSEADLASEKLIVEKIQSQFPTHDIMTEEQDFKSKGSDWTWVIDPLDGTTNYVHSLPIFAVSIGLKYKSETVIGVVYNPAVDAMYHAVIDKGAFRNGDEIHVSKTKKLGDSFLVTGFAYDHNDEWELSFDLFRDIYRKSQGIRRLGAAALDLCFVAQGRFDGFFEINLFPWDITAGDLILREAGGFTSGWKGENLPASGKKVLATNGIIQDEILDIFQNEKYTLFTNY